MNSLVKYIITIWYLRRKQIYYLIRKRAGISNLGKKKIIYNATIGSSNSLVLLPSIPSSKSYFERKFSFLNQTYFIDDNVNWNYLKFGKLWTYNLNYFEYLNQSNFDLETGVNLILNYLSQIDNINDGLEPFPTSLRGINWIKFLTLNGINDLNIDRSLFKQYIFLFNNVEFHLLGNHLLENAFSLLYGAYYFQNEYFYLKSKKILIKELEEQVMEDGAHFELSPMYHQLILFRILDCYNLVKFNSFKNQELLGMLEDKVKIMLSWINKITFKNGKIPLFNDSAFNIAPTTEELNQYAKRLLIEIDEIEYLTQLGPSGYRNVSYDNYELIIDVGNIGPDYIPGHAHADTFNFELYVNELPFIVDTGISTYEKNEIRQYERSTISHNTVVINNRNQSQVWGGFRVGKRARVIELVETINKVSAIHDGYRGIGVLHERAFITNPKSIEIKDFIIGKKENAKAYFHFHPSVNDLFLDDNKIIFKELNSRIEFLSETINIEIKKFRYALGFNKTKEGKLVEISFRNKLTTIISFNL